MTDRERIQALERCTGVSFGEDGLALALEALTHKSHANETSTGAGTPPPDNERLEFLGDAVIDLAISQRLMERFPLASEGELSRLRASVVNEGALATVARALCLGELLLLGRGEERTGGREKVSVLANALEAVIGAIYVRHGMAGTLAFVDRSFAAALDGTARGMFDLDFKSRVQELSQAAYKVGPRYRIVAQEGPDHARVYTVELVLGDAALGQGTGPSKKEAEQAAARQALPAIESRIANGEPLPESLDKREDAT